MPYTKDFDSWNEYKKDLEKLKTPLAVYDKKTESYKYLFRTSEIWYCSVGVNIGVEICGKNQHFERPVLVIRKTGRSFVCLPMTSQKPNNPMLYYDLSFTDENNESVESYVLITSPLTFDVNRLQRRVRKVFEPIFKDLMKKYLDVMKSQV